LDHDKEKSAIKNGEEEKEEESKEIKHTKKSRRKLTKDIREEIVDKEKKLGMQSTIEKCMATRSKPGKILDR
jgi:hypothetical protein